MFFTRSFVFGCRSSMHWRRALALRSRDAPCARLCITTSSNRPDPLSNPALTAFHVWLRLGLWLLPGCAILCCWPMAHIGDEGAEFMDVVDEQWYKFDKQVLHVVSHIGQKCVFACLT